MSEESKERKRVTFDKKILSSPIKSKIKLRTQEIEMPELNAIMGLEKEEIAIMIVRQLKFEELIEIQQGQFDIMRNLVEGVIEASTSKEAVKREVSQAMDRKSVVFIQRIDIIEKCLVEPKLSRSEVIYISKMFPSVAVKLHSAIMSLTDKGADLKKNSTG